MLPALEPSRTGPQGETVPWTMRVFLLLSDEKERMVVAKLTALLAETRA